MLNHLKLTLLACFLFFQYGLQAEVHYIGLGRDCQIASHLERLFLRKAAYPFDWMVSHNFNGITQAIDENFIHFLDANVLLHKGPYIENVYYQFLFNHFFPLVGRPVTEEVCEAGTVVPNFFDYLPQVQTTQNRRIERFINLLSSDDHVVFIRTHATAIDAALFVNMIENKYPQLQFTLVVVNDMTNFSGAWNIPHVLNYYGSQYIGFADWWTYPEWDAIFEHLRGVVEPPCLSK
jgi:hypothetical protein